MNIDFEIFEAGPVISVTDEPYVSITSRGRIFLNRHAIGSIGNPEAVMLMYDRRRKIIGIMPCERRRKGAFPLRRKDRTTSRVIYANNFCKVCGIRVSETLAFLSPEVNHNGILVLNLQEVRSVKKT